MAKRGKRSNAAAVKPATRDVYALRDVERGFAKHGVSNDARHRIKTFHTGSPVDYVFDHIETVAYGIAHEVEATARKIVRYDEKVSMKREWTKCTSEEAREAIIVAHGIVRGRNSNRG